MNKQVIEKMSYNEELENKIDHHFISRDDLMKKKQMDGVGWLVNGNMCCGIYEDSLVVRIEPIYGRSLLKKPGIEPFGERDGADGLFISLNRKIYEYPKALKKFLTHSLEYTTDLPPKPTSKNPSH